MSDATNPVEIEHRDRVALVRLAWPERKNALDIAMRRALAGAFTRLTEDPAVRVIVVTGSEGVFAAGADLRMLAPLGPSEVRELGLLELWRPIAECPKPVIAAVSGPAFGAGCELALMCDVIVADRTAQFGLPECRVGIMPGSGGTQRLVRAFGKPMASLALMTGNPIAAERAFQLGLACMLADPGQAETDALALAETMASRSPPALAAIKRVLTAGADLPLAAANALENREFLLLFDGADQKEGMTAFLEKRKPEFQGR